eukprot:GEMP01078733.1.p1 GENE.GEMP01078733.1~~GEMP01078733.1.p1  ORF type:complete len:229 (+),score=42.99 GEMP01078733.1:204-890(+)
MELPLSFRKVNLRINTSTDREVKQQVKTNPQDDWCRRLSDDGRVYFFNRRSNASQWHLPNELYKSKDRSASVTVDEDEVELTYSAFPSTAGAMVGVNCVTELVNPEKRHAMEQMSAFVDYLASGSRRFCEVGMYLPEDVFTLLGSQEFADMCDANFDSSDTDGNGVLSLDELIPLMQELAIGRGLKTTQGHCRRLYKILDANGDGDICRDEFLTFVQFLCALSSLEVS